MARADDIPRKRAYKLSEVCQYTDTQPYVLRFWESEFPQLSPKKSSTGQPVYSRGDIDLVLRIKTLLYEQEETLAGARELIESGADGPVERAAGAAEATADEPETTPGNGRPASPQLGALRVDEPGDSDDTVERQRYDDALEEISHLRFQLKDLETRVRRAESAAEKSREEAAKDRGRVERAAERVRRLIASLGGPTA